jgi:hypothetical protein
MSKKTSQGSSENPTNSSGRLAVIAGINLVLRYSDLVASNSISVSRASISGSLPPSGALFIVHPNW